MPMENFFRVRAEKQNHIINAALAIFGRQGYRKASLSDIAKEAGITKGMITYYFGSKKNLYLYLVEIFHARMLSDIETRIDAQPTDLFDRLKIILDANFEIIKEHPHIISFSNSLYREKDDEVFSEIDKIIEFENEKDHLIFEAVDTSKFKSDIDHTLASDILLWIFNGALEALFEKNLSEEEVNALINRLYEGLDLMKKMFYKP